ncbi:MAG TPA: fused MFS/spermidine synthase, partial [Spirochaetia bacterium]|nr:fused MFS/spermidine synthase [Spirochaetia bacterium]
LLLRGGPLLSGLRVASGLWILALIGLLLGGVPGALAGAMDRGSARGRVVLYEKDSPYSYIRVTDTPDALGVERTLRLDALVHNKTDPEHPDSLRYEYERIFEAMTRFQAERLAVGGSAAVTAARFATLTLGGGGFTMPSYLERHYPEAHHAVVEIDPDVVAAAHRYFGLSSTTGLDIEISDARRYVRSAGGRSWDIIYCDAFNAFSVPAHLTTREFTEAVARILSPNGIYLANVIDVFDSGRFLAAYLDTVQSVFSSTAVYVDPSFRTYARATFVVAAAGAPAAGVPAARASAAAFPAELRDPNGTLVGRELTATETADLRAHTHPLVLTDDRAPVDTLMAPVFLRAVH